MPKKILLADDSITIQKVVELTFSDGDYEVIATNNGTKAIQEIPKVRPDIILSDIIMPEKNGYEVCEWVKSHPEHRSIPVILLTGTFEPFDPDRAEKAGCDAVVTKPFESQSLIQKVEELIGRRAAPAPELESPPTERHPIITDEPESEAPGMAPDEPMAPFAAEEPSAPSPFDETPADTPTFEEPGGEPVQAPAFELGEPSAQESAPFEGAEGESTPAPQQVAESTPFPPDEEEPRPQGDVFASEVASPPAEMEDSATRIIPKMSMEDIQRLQQQQQQEEPAEPLRPSPPEALQDEEVPPPLPPQAEQPVVETAPESAPFGAPDEEFEDSATRIIPKMSMEDIQRIQQQQAESQPEQPETAPFGGEQESEGAPFGAEDEAESSLDMGAPSTPSEEDEDASTRMIPKMAFADLPGVGDESGTEPFQEPPESAESPGFVPGAPGAPEEAAAPNPFEAEAEAEAPQPSMEEAAAPFAEPPAEQVPPPPLPPEQPAATSFEEPEAETETTAAAAASGDLTEAQIDAIAKRVVEMISDKVIREIAWEVIPETAEMIVRERIRQLEAEED